MLYQDNYFAVIVNLIFCEKTYCIDDERKVQPVTDTDSEFTECHTPRKNLQSIGTDLSVYIQNLITAK